MGSSQQRSATMTHTFDIRVALVGYVSVGKSTILNALLGDEFSQVDVKRTTAGVNLFRILQPSEGEESIPAKNVQLQDVESIHKEISKDNQELRSRDTVEEKTFDVRIRRPICDMRSDTRLVLIDIPGINEAESSKKYKNYVEAHWKTFDCVVVVMDAIQGVNTEEQVELLKFVERNNRTFKSIPAIILANKMDDPNDRGTVQLVEEFFSKNIQIFGNVDYKSMSHEIGSADDTKPSTTTTTFIPLSAKNAYTYMKARNIDLDRLNHPKYHDLFNKIGSDEFGRMWSRMKDEDKIEAVSEILNDPAELEKRLAGTNFDSFLVALSDSLGGNAKQKDILLKRMEARLKSIGDGSVDENESISEVIFDVYRMIQSIGQNDLAKDDKLSNEDLQCTFWKAYESCEKEVFEILETKVCPKALERPFLELEKHHQVAEELHWTKSSAKVFESMTALLRKQLLLVLKKLEAWSFESFCLAAGATIEKTRTTRCNITVDGHHCYECSQIVKTKSVYPSYTTCNHNNFQGASFRHGWKQPKLIEWEVLSPLEWITILESISLVWNQSRFIEDFGSEKVKLDSALAHFRRAYREISGVNLSFSPEASSISTMTGERASAIYMYAYHDELKTNGNNSAISSTRINMPDSLLDPSHWGFLAWTYIKFCRKRVAKNLVGAKLV